MDVTVRWTGPSSDPSLSDMSMSAATGSGHMLAMDGAPAVGSETIGGRNLAPRPMEVVLAGTGGCTLYDVVLILRRGRMDVRDCDVKLTAERAATDPKVFTKIHFHFVVRGRGLSRDAVARAVRLSHEKYCSASVMLAKTATLSHSYEIVEL